MASISSWSIEGGWSFEQSSWHSGSTQGEASGRGSHEGRARVEAKNRDALLFLLEVATGAAVPSTYPKRRDEKIAPFSRPFDRKHRGPYHTR